MCERCYTDDRESLIPRCATCGEYMVSKDLHEERSCEGSCPTFRTIEEILRMVEMETTGA